MVASYLYLLFQLRRRARQGSYPVLHSALTTLACMLLVLTLNQVNEQFWNVFVFKLNFFAIFQLNFADFTWILKSLQNMKSLYPFQWNLKTVPFVSVIVGVYSDTDGGQLVFLLQGQRGGVTHVLFSPDGTKLYSGGRKVKINDVIWQHTFPFLEVFLMPFMHCEWFIQLSCLL